MILTNILVIDIFSSHFMKIIRAMVPRMLKMGMDTKATKAATLVASAPPMAVARGMPIMA